MGPVTCGPDRRGLYRYDGTRFRLMAAAEGLPCATEVHALHVAADGALWANTCAQVFRFDGQSFHAIVGLRADRFAGQFRRPRIGTRGKRSVAPLPESGRARERQPLHPQHRRGQHSLAASSPRRRNRESGILGRPHCSLDAGPACRSFVGRGHSVSRL
jgi:hypothetical protein